jgi:hypothetical protein
MLRPFRVSEITNFITFNFIYVQCCTNNGCNFNSTTALANGKQIYLSEYFNHTLLYLVYLFYCCDNEPYIVDLHLVNILIYIHYRSELQDKLSTELLHE